MAAAFAAARCSPRRISQMQPATEVVNEWNAQHAATQSAVLLPVKWETHATPRSGVRPQEAINKQLVRVCDILIGMFWTKLGTSTGAAGDTTRKRPTRVFIAKEIMLRFLNNEMAVQP